MAKLENDRNRKRPEQKMTKIEMTKIKNDQNRKQFKIILMRLTLLSIAQLVFNELNYIETNFCRKEIHTGTLKQNKTDDKKN